MRPVAAVAAVLLAACSSASRRPAPAATTCSGDRTVIVNNRSNKDADVIAMRREDGGPIGLGTVMPGRQEEFTLPKEASFARTLSSRETSPPKRGTVDMRYGCRQ